MKVQFPLSKICQRTSFCNNLIGVFDNLLSKQAPFQHFTDGPHIVDTSKTCIHYHKLAICSFNSNIFLMFPGISLAPITHVNTPTTSYNHLMVPKNKWVLLKTKQNMSPYRQHREQWHVSPPVWLKFSYEPVFSQNLFLSHSPII